MKRPTTAHSAITTEDARRTVYPRELVWFTPRVMGGKIAARVIHIDLENKDVELEITATGSNIYLRGTRAFHVPFTQVFKRSIVSNALWPTPRFSLRWLDYPTDREQAGAEWQTLFPLTVAAVE